MSSSSGKELEVKFFLNSLPALQARLEALGARLVHERVLETNLRFDTAGGELGRTFRVLRLRKDSVARVTYKGPGTVEGGVRSRQELEFTVSDFTAAKAVFEALGYQVVVMYEKYRATYWLDNVEIVLDEMPYGNFAEIEGPDGDSIQAVADKLSLDWTARVIDSYIMLFDRLRLGMGFAFNDLSFANFAGITVTGEMLGVRLADISSS